jgi:hypothetical protein
MASQQHIEYVVCSQHIGEIKKSLVYYVINYELKEIVQVHHKTQGGNLASSKKIGFLNDTLLNTNNKDQNISHFLHKC